MHTYQTKTTAFIYNGDFSGEIHIRDKRTGQEISIPAHDLPEFVAYTYVAPKRVTAIESMDWKALLA